MLTFFDDATSKNESASSEIVQNHLESGSRSMRMAPVSSCKNTVKRVLVLWNQVTAPFESEPADPRRPYVPETNQESGRESA